MFLLFQILMVEEKPKFQSAKQCTCFRIKFYSDVVLHSVNNRIIKNYRNFGENIESIVSTITSLFGCLNVDLFIS